MGQHLEKRNEKKQDHLDLSGTADRKTVQSAHLPYPGTPDYTYPGGLRIKEINNYDSNDELLTRKHYYYTKEFTPTTKGGVSSGILSFTPQYLWGWQLYNLLKSQDGGPEYYTLNAIMSQASNPLWYNSRGEYIGYSKVIECNEDKNGKLYGFFFCLFVLLFG